LIRLFIPIAKSRWYERNASLTSPIRSGFGLFKERYSCGNQTDDKKGYEIIADEKNQSRREVRVIHGSDTNFVA
jgi:hypothetical protein